jgi:hypothetical protein
MIRCPESDLQTPARRCAIERKTAGELAGHLVEAHAVSASVAFARAREAANGAAVPTSPAPEPVATPTPRPRREAPMEFKPKTCPDCKKPFTPTGGPQKRCADCAVKAKRQADRDRGSGGGTRKPAKPSRAKPSPATPRPAAPRSSGSPVLDILDAAIADLERRLSALRTAREILA